MNATRVLLVDDEPMFVISNEKLLKLRGYEVFTALSGEEALQQLEKNDIDVVVLDIKMPGIDGIEVLKEIKQRFDLVEVIMLTGHATFETAVIGLRIGAGDYLMKPCELDELIQKIEEAGEKRKINIEKVRRI